MNFKNIPEKYRPIPFWSWNDKLNTEETKEQIRQMKIAGFGGFFMHARGGLQTEYMGEEWFDNISAGVEVGKELNMSAWAYDENGWPSGFGNGLVNGKGIEFQQKSLHYEIGEKHTDTTIANIDGIHYYYEINPFYVDLLDKNVTKTFIEEIYAPYHEKYGNDIEGFFTDEPQLSRSGLPWSFKLEEEYKSEYNEELLNRLPELFFEKGEYVDTRIKFWRLVTKLLTNGFSKQIFEWCEGKNIKFTGHMFDEDAFFNQMSSGAVMPSYRYFHIPGMDALGRNKVNKITIYQVASVAQQFGKEQVLSETFALAGWNVSFEELKELYEWQMVRGVNLLCIHLSAYSLRGIRKRDYPAAFSYQDPWWEKFDLFSDSMSRIGMLLAKGQIECDTLLIHPQSTTWTLYNGIWSDEILKYNNLFNSIIDDLERKHISFNLGDEIIIEENAYIDGKYFVIGNQKYDKIILPPHLVLFESTKKLLEEFKENGGIVLNGTDKLPSLNYVNNENIIYTKRKFNEFDMYYFVNSTSEKQEVEIKNGTHILNILTGETEPLDKKTHIEPAGSLVVLDYKNKAMSKPNTFKEYEKIDIAGDWDIVKADYNAITLDKCEYSFDGVMIEKNGHVLSIQEKACALERKVRIDMKYIINAEYVPEKLFLVCETPEIFSISINGKRISKDIVGYYIDKAFKKIDISKTFQLGNNEILITCDFEQSDITYENIKKSRIFESEKNKLTFDMEIENIYLIGDFSVKTNGVFKKLANNACRYRGEFILSAPKKQISLAHIEQQGYPFFAGKIIVKKKFKAKKGCSYCIELTKKLVNIVSVKINDKSVGDILWKPYLIDIDDYIDDGENYIELELYTSLRNLLGPHHTEEECYAVTPAVFYKDVTVWGTWGKVPWNEDYCFVDFSLF